MVAYSSARVCMRSTSRCVPPCARIEAYSSACALLATRSELTGQITIAVAHRLELGGGEERRAAELGHVGQQLHAGHAAGEFAEHLRASFSASGKIASAPASR